MKKKLASAGGAIVLASALVLGSSVAASATTENVGGGTWVYNADNASNYSNYYHGSSKHRSSVQNRYGLVRSGDKPGGQWAYASQPVAITNNQAFWYVY